MIVPQTSEKAILYDGKCNFIFLYHHIHGRRCQWPVSMLCKECQGFVQWDDWYSQFIDALFFFFFFLPPVLIVNIICYSRPMFLCKVTMKRSMQVFKFKVDYLSKMSYYIMVCGLCYGKSVIPVSHTA